MINHQEGLDIFAEGVPEILPDGDGFLRSSENNYMPGPDDVCVAPSQIRRFELRAGDLVSGKVRPPNQIERYFALISVETVNSESLEKTFGRVAFDNLRSCLSQECLKLETTRENLVPRFIDLMTPLGKGQCALVIGPRLTGKRLILESIANSLGINHPKVAVIVLLIDVHPDEAAATRRSLKAEVCFTTWNEPEVRHIQVAELVVEKAKRLVEEGRDVAVLMDSLSQLASAYRAVFSSLGGVSGSDPNARARRHTKPLLGSTRNVGGGGSLTMLVTVETEISESVKDILLEDCKGIADVSIILDHQVARQGIFPAINIHRSGNRKHELLIAEEELARVKVLRKVLEPLAAGEGAKLLAGKLIASRSNKEFLANMSSL